MCFQLEGFVDWGNDARLKNRVRRAGGPLRWVEADCYQLPVGLNVKDLPAVSAPARLGATRIVDWDAPAGAREGVDKDVARTTDECPQNVGDPPPIRGDPRSKIYGARELISPAPFGLPHPVTRSNPFWVEYVPLLPLVMSWKVEE